VDDSSAEDRERFLLEPTLSILAMDSVLLLESELSEVELSEDDLSSPCTSMKASRTSSSKQSNLPDVDISAQFLVATLLLISNAATSLALPLSLCFPALLMVDGPLSFAGVLESGLVGGGPLSLVGAFETVLMRDGPGLSGCTAIRWLELGAAADGTIVSVGAGLEDRRVETGAVTGGLEGCRGGAGAASVGLEGCRDGAGAERRALFDHASGQSRARCPIWSQILHRLGIGHSAVRCPCSWQLKQIVSEQNAALWPALPHFLHVAVCPSYFTRSW